MQMNQKIFIIQYKIFCKLIKYHPTIEETSNIHLSLKEYRFRANEQLILSKTNSLIPESYNVKLKGDIKLTDIETLQLLLNVKEF